jgi:hypothetical protein
LIEIIHLADPKVAEWDGFVAILKADWAALWTLGNFIQDHAPLLRNDLPGPREGFSSIRVAIFRIL